MIELNDQTAEAVADRFRALGDATRLRILNTLRSGESTVGKLVSKTGLGQANVSKHLQTLHRQGFVERRRDGTRTIYRVDDPAVFELCDLVCGKIRDHLERQREALVPGSRG
jgi:DNA-binding transcriptional ArsR family regulator